MLDGDLYGWKLRSGGSQSGARAARSRKRPHAALGRWGRNGGSWLSVLLLVGLFALSELAAPAPAWAGRRGGSFGRSGGFSRRSFSSRLGGSGRSSRSSGRVGGLGGGGSRFFVLPFFFGGGHHGRGSAGGFFSFLITLLVVGGVIYVIWRLFRLFRKRKREDGGWNESSADGAWRDASTDGGGFQSLGGPSVGLVKLQLGYSSAARSLQRDLADLARQSSSGQDSSGQADAWMLRETTTVLIRALDHLRYSASTTAFGLDPKTAESRFQRWATEARSVYDVEGIRGDERGVRESDEKVEESYQAAELVVVTLLVASSSPRLAQDLSKTESFDADRMMDMLNKHAMDDPNGLGALLNDPMRHSLEVLGSQPAEDLMGFEVVWVPDQPEASLTEEEAMTLFPELIQR